MSAPVTARDPNVRRAVWINGKKRITGTYEWCWASQRYHVVLDSRDPITGLIRVLSLSGDAPEWGKWKLEDRPND